MLQLPIRQLLLSFLSIACITILYQHLADISFIKNELVYLASPYYDFRGLAKSGVYLASYTLAIMLIWSCIFIKQKFFWLLTLFLLFILVMSDIFVQIAANDRGFTKFEYAIALTEHKSYDNMLMFIKEAGLSSLYASLLLAVIVFWRSKIQSRLSASAFAVFVMLAFSLIYGAKQWVYYIKYPSYPAVVKIPLIIADYHANTLEQLPRILDEEILPVKGHAQEQNLVWIIDESIGGQYLSVNGFDKETTPYLETLKNSDQMSNFGIVNSVSNCSAFSNLMMRIGLSSHTVGVEDSYVNTRNKLPSIFQYAKRAGYQTWLFDAQADEGQLQNYLTPHDMKSIDHFITLDTRTEDYQRDLILMNKLTSGIQADTSNKHFIIFIKDGAHWPYLWRYPHDKEVFSPVQSTIYEEKTLENKGKLINTYSNVVKYTVDDFFAEYLAKVDLAETLTFYTSDHGQNLLEEGANTPLTHCTTEYDAPVSQAMVPLIMFGENVTERFPVSENRVYSQFQIFPTMLSLMGYGKDITSNYGQSLLEGQPLSSERWFYFGMEGDRVPFILEK